MPSRLGLAFDVAIHLGTLAAVVIYFRATCSRMAAALPAALSLATPIRRRASSGWS